MHFAIGAGDEVFQVVFGGGLGGKGGELGEVGGGAFVKQMELPQFLQAHSEGGIGLEPADRPLQFRPVWAFAGEEFVEVNDHGISSDQLSLFDAEVLGNQFGAEPFVLQERKADAAPLQDLLKFPQLLPKQMSAEMLIEIIEGGQVGIGEQRDDSGRLNHADQDQVLAADQVDVADETFREDRVIQGGQEENERAAAQSQADESADFIIIGGRFPGLQGIEGIAAGAVMGLAVAGAEEGVDLVGKGEDAEQVALLLRRQSEHEGRGNETFQDGVGVGAFGRAGQGKAGFGSRIAGRETGGIEDDVHLLGALDLEDFGDRLPALGGGFPMDFIESIAGNVFAELFEIASAADLALGVEPEGAAMQEKGRQLVALAEQAGIDAQFRGGGQGFADRPKAEPRSRFNPHGLDSEIPPAAGAAGPAEAGPLASFGQGDEGVFLG